MAELACVTAVAWSREFQSASRSDWVYSVTFGPDHKNPTSNAFTYHCNCIGFSTRKKCKHVTECKQNEGKPGYRCGWRGDFSELGPDGTCPKCGKDVMADGSEA